ncbi:LysR substrate-binding domain-containing protein [Pigmentiphaga soli]|uniref:LysR substrate-binding domain-containing protein n=1 Tax=Pigmentiphaga soli TaxID=1007095 RepID=A0ABP8H5M8_9BURK
MRRALPSMAALSAFEAAGRLGSFSAAAEELHVTQGAISRQIRGLEEYLGTRLFLRLTRQVELTAAGEAYLREVQYALDYVERATAGFRTRQSQHVVLTISALPSIASFWLMSRLVGFSQRYPHIDTRVLTSIRAVDLQSNEADVAIRVGPLPGKSYEARLPRIDLEMVTNWRGVHAEPLFDDVLVPVLSPGLPEPGHEIREPRDLLRYPLIHTASRARAWPDWLALYGLQEPERGERAEYGHFFMAIEAARKGQGVALIPGVLLSGIGGGLVAPIRCTTPSAGSYYLLMRSDRVQDPQCAAFCDWIQEQAGEVQACV